jgi:hypothetical protein
MCHENPLWGAPRIHGELLKLGIDVGETSVGKYIVRKRKPPSQNWRTFLENHVKTMVSIDFFTVPTLRFQVLYVFLVLAHDRRRIVHFNVTAHPTAEWTGQQLREAFPFEQFPRYLLRDRDGIFGAEFRKDVAAMGIKEVLSTPPPWQRACVERVIGTIRRSASTMRDRSQRGCAVPAREHSGRTHHESRTHSLAKDAPEPGLLRRRARRRRCDTALAASPRRRAAQKTPGHDSSAGSVPIVVAQHRQDLFPFAIPRGFLSLSICLANIKSYI